jgi:hypothetical protein
MREKRLSMVVFPCFFDGRRNRGSVSKLAKRASVIGADEGPPLLFDFFIVVVVNEEFRCGVALLVAKIGWGRRTEVMEGQNLQNLGGDKVSAASGKIGRR